MTLPPHAPARETRSSTLSIVALALAIVLPLVGLVLGLVARTKSKASGSPTTVATTAAVIGAILTVAWTVAIVVFLTFGGAPVGQTEPSETATPTPQSDSSAQPEAGEVLVVEITAERDLDDQTLAAARTALAFYGENAGIAVIEVTETDTGELAVTFASDVSATDIDAFAQGISEPAAEGFYSVAVVHPPTGGAVLDDGSKTPPCDALRFGPLAATDTVIACDEAMQTQLVLDAPARIAGDAISDVEVNGDVVAVTLSEPNATEFTEWTGEAAAAAPPANQIALVDFIGVITAPTVAGELAGEFQMSGATLDTELLAARLRLLGDGVAFAAHAE